MMALPESILKDCEKRVRYGRPNSVMSFVPFQAPASMVEMALFRKSLDHQMQLFIDIKQVLERHEGLEGGSAKNSDVVVR